MISPTYPQTKLSRRAIPLPREAAPRPVATPQPHAEPLEPSDVWDRVNIILLVQPRSKLAEAVKYLGIPIRSIDRDGWAEIMPTAEEYVLCIAYARRFSGDKVPPQAATAKTAPLMPYNFSAPLPEWDELPPPDEMEDA